MSALITPTEYQKSAARNTSINQWLTNDSDPMAKNLHEVYNQWYCAIRAESELRVVAQKMADVLSSLGLFDSIVGSTSSELSLERGRSYPILKAIEAMPFRPLTQRELEIIEPYSKLLAEVKFPDNKADLLAMCSYPTSEALAENIHHQTLIRQVIDLRRWQLIAAIDKRAIESSFLPLADSLEYKTILQWAVLDRLFE